jgi:Bacterial PH domain
MRSLRELFTDAYERFARWLDRIAEDGLLRMFWWRITSVFHGLSGHRRVSRKLIPGERTIDVGRTRRPDGISEVTHSKILYIVPGLIGAVGIYLLLRSLFSVPLDDIGFVLLLSLGILGYALYQFLKISRDRFVVTDSRVFRVWGVWTLQGAEMEIVRVLDITVVRPWFLRPFATGHVILENAAQEQGLREIRIVPYPEKIATAIHRRRREMMGLAGDEVPGESVTPRQASASPRRGRRPNHPRSPGPTTARPH